MTEKTDDLISTNTRDHKSDDSAGGSEDVDRSRFIATTLRSRIKGQVLTPSDPDFERVALGVWNQYGTDARRPQLIVRVADERDVVEAVKYAKDNKLKVVVRGGGHNWCNPSLRNGGMMIDLADLNQVISIDAKARRAVVQPFISNREIQARLNAQDLSFPSGHCPPVKLSGYLLSGGMSWNQGVWGPGVGSVEAVELVTADGEMITADKNQNTDYYWAARGAGSGFFGVVTRYHLRLYDLPKAIACSSYYYPIGEVETIAQWLESIAGKLPANIELSLFMVTAPPEIAAQSKAAGDKVCMVTATIFADSMEEARFSLKALDDCPVISKCLSKTFAKPFNFEALFDASGILWPADHHNQVEAVFSNAKLADVFHALRDHFLETPSPTTLIMFAIFTGPNVPAPLPDAAFSMSARYYGGPWTMWKKSEDDTVNAKWHERCLELLQPFVAGYYVGESDTVTYPHIVRDSYTEDKLQRLGELRKKYDPDGVFFNYFEGLT
jgi:FAD/FMN-containing dehydrogenase